jgi:predicted N-acetyltransferase YhbS
MPRAGKLADRILNPYRLVDRVPSLDEYFALRSDATWHLPNRKIARAALKRSLYSVVALRDNTVVGCARIVGDGLYLYLQDVIVRSAARRCGIGTALVRRCMAVSTSLAPAESGCLIALMATPELKLFYARFGFKPIPEHLSFMYIRRT